jgi:hypothetical protein
MTTVTHIDVTPQPIQQLVGMLSHKIGRPLQAEQLLYPTPRWCIFDAWMNDDDEIVLCIVIFADDGCPSDWRYETLLIGNDESIVGDGCLQQLLSDLTKCN